MTRVVDFSRPLVDAESRTDHDWHWGVTQTVRAGRLGAMIPGVEYSLTVKVQRALDASRADTFARLYARAGAIADLRMRAVAGDDPDVRHWILCHSWRTVAVGDTPLAFAMVMTGLIRLAPGQAPPTGEPRPTGEAFRDAGGATMADMQRFAPQRATEVFVEFDHRSPGASTGAPFMYSYGERVETDAVNSFEPFVRRAEACARAHQAAFGVPAASAEGMSIASRQWYLTDRLVTVELQLAAAS